MIWGKPNGFLKTKAYVVVLVGVDHGDDTSNEDVVCINERTSAQSDAMPLSAGSFDGSKYSAAPSVAGNAIVHTRQSFRLLLVHLPLRMNPNPVKVTKRLEASPHPSTQRLKTKIGG